MIYWGTAICIVFIGIAIILLRKKYHAPAVLLICGLSMLTIAHFMGLNRIVEGDSNWWFFDLFGVIKESFSTKNAGVGLMIMTIGGYVAYMDKIGASETLVYLAMKPLKIFKKSPYLACSLVIPIGHFLSIPIPSASGLGLLLIASVFPVLINLGVSKVAAVSVIVSTTVFDMGPASPNTLLAAELIGSTGINYFIEHQLRVAIPLIILMAVLYYFVNRYFDKSFEPVLDSEDSLVKKPEKPLFYALLPIFPLILLIIFSDFVNLFDARINLNTTTAMLVSMAVAMSMEFLVLRNGKEVMASLKIFWDAMGRVFATIITLIIAAEIFSNGLIGLGFIDMLVFAAQQIGFEATGITAVITILIFSASILMGSGNASFYSFGPLVPDIATKLGANAAVMILPMQLSASLGRAISPIAGVVIATAEIAGVTPMQIVKRNFIPLSITLICLLIFTS